MEKEKIGQSCVSHLHWSPFQMLAHQASTGCGLEVGDLIGTGTLSSSKVQAEKTFGVSERSMRLGCLLEQCEDGKRPVETAQYILQWLEDGDEITMEGWAGEGASRIGFGQVSGIVSPASA
jgi:fumarylacetoacetase